MKTSSFQVEIQALNSSRGQHRSGFIRVYAIYAGTALDSGGGQGRGRDEGPAHVLGCSHTECADGDRGSVLMCRSY